MEQKRSYEFRSEARSQLKGNWTTAVLAMLVFGIVHILACIPYIGIIISILINGPLILGMTLFFMKLVRGEQFKIEDIFSGFKNLGSGILLNILAGIFIFLWGLLLIIPGIIAKYRYAMAYYILNDNPEIGAMEAIRRSKKMMIGHKWQLFCLHFSFIGWAILCVLSFGIGLLWLKPYINAAVTNFYENLKMTANEEV